MTDTTDHNPTAVPLTAEEKQDMDRIEARVFPPVADQALLNIDFHVMAAADAYERSLVVMVATCIATTLSGPCR